MATSPITACPSCRSPMEVLKLASVQGTPQSQVELDVCFACQGMWFDPQENLKLAPAAVAELFKILHDHRDTVSQPVSPQLGCPRCRAPLTHGFDVVRSGRYITYRCPNRDGRFSTFSSFMIEKGFVRQLSRPEIDTLAQHVSVIHCSSCGAPVDIRKDHACPHCRSAFSLIDPKAVEKALAGYAKAKTSSGTSTDKAPDVADALMMLERDRIQAQREQKSQRTDFLTESSSQVDLLALGVALVWKMLD